ncbi:hypothetical protein F383_17486 [Gossypium arboreum]|uniref:Uncharacterized protein n=1 Tax=Gossypium arboreum TaxID=29729 RepID=A0A0B0NNL1_GOSAR|nr:hypothetical protein F383_17486 [Gossypium arboreum]
MWRSYMYCGLTTARMSLQIYQLFNRTYCPSAQEELTDHSSKE